MRRPSSILVLALLMGGATPIRAEPTAGQGLEMRAPKASDERLDRLRGGADLGQSLHISFGLDRLTSVNGAIVASTQFQVQDIAHVTASEALAMQRALGTILTLTNGQASMTALPAGNQSLGTVIQNSLPDQAIRNIVTLSMATNSLTLLRATNAADQLRNLSLPGH